MSSHPEPADTYHSIREELTQALRGASVAEALMLVPACPEWTVKDVVAHLSGLNVDLLANIRPLGSDEATSRQVDARSLMTLDEVLDEWASLADPIRAHFHEDPDIAVALTADLVTHAFDIEELLGQTTVAAASATAQSAHRHIPLLQERVADALDIGLSVDLDDGTLWQAPETGSQSITVSTSTHRFLRGVTGRLRREEVEAFSWSDDPSDILDQAWNRYGPFRIS